MSTGINIEIGANGTAAAREIRKVGHGHVTDRKLLFLK